MGSVKGFIDLLRGVIKILVTYAFLSPVLDVLISMNMIMGGNNARIASMIDTIVYIIVPIVLIVSYVLYAFLSSTREEDASVYTRW